MNPFPESSRAHELFEAIRGEVPLADLGPGDLPTSDWVRKVADIDDRTLLGAEPVDRDMSNAVRSGLLLRANFLDASHTISQGIETGTGSYWHGIMHRREGDFGNAKYWFRRVGEHPLFETLATTAPSLNLSEASELLSGSWDPFRFVDLCESRFSQTGELARELTRLQDLEISLLLGFSFERATNS